jgi:hypothetical protein
VPSRSRRSPKTPRPVGQLASGEPYYAPLGRMRSDGERLQCHLCARWLRRVGGSHLLTAHGWTTAEYREAFRLNVTASTVGPVTRERMRETMLEQIESGERQYRLPPAGPPTPAGWRSLGALRPEWLADWRPDRNGDLDPFTIAPRSGRIQIWWRCRYCGHEWQTTPLGRGQSTGGCRSCARRRPPPTDPVASARHSHRPRTGRAA